MKNRPFVVLSCAVSVDGYLDDASDTRLVLSNAADLDRMHEVRAGVDAIMVGANTIRRDNPRLLVRGAAAGPVKVTVTAGGDLDPASLFFTTGDAEKLVYAPTEAAVKLRDRLAGLATVVDCGERTELTAVLTDLAARGIGRLMVEGGGTILTQLLAAGLADELHLVVAPMLIGDVDAPRFVHNGHFDTPMALAEVRRIGEVVLLRYVFGPAAEDRHRLAEAVDLSRQCPPSSTAFSVGAVIVDRDGVELARGYSRESGGTEHAEEAALAKLPPGDPRLRSATIYSSMEPCGKRASRPRTCARLIIEAGLPRVVFALREPKTFVDPTGAEQLAAAGVDLVEIPDLADDVRQINRHLG